MLHLGMQKCAFKFRLLLQAAQPAVPAQTPPTPGPVFAPVFSPTYAPNFSPPMQQPAAAGGLFMQGPDGNFYPVQHQSSVAAPMMAMARLQSMFNPAQGLQSPRMMMYHQPSMFSPAQMLPTAGASHGMLIARQPSMFAADPTAVGSPRLVPSRQHSIFYQPQPQPAVQSQTAPDPTPPAAAAPADAVAAVQDPGQMVYMPEAQQPMFDPSQIFAPLPELYDPAQMFGAAPPMCMPNQPRYGTAVDPSSGSWSQMPGPSQVGLLMLLQHFSPDLHSLTVSKYFWVMFSGGLQISS